MDFMKFKQAVAKRFNWMTDYPLFRADVTKDELWDTYLASFPAGTNPIFRERTEHDCNCCRQFIRAIGNVVAVVNGERVSLWDIEVDEPAYQVVANSLATLVKSRSIQNIFLHTERVAGTDKTFDTRSDSSVVTWNHFFVNIPCGRGTDKNFVVSGAELGTRLSDTRAIHDVFYRGLTELTDDAVDTVYELTSQGIVYRGDEYNYAVSKFRDLKAIFNNLPEDQRDNFVWLKSLTIPVPISKIRNTAIGTLLIDLSNNVELKDAVKTFEESIMAPSNFKRPTALVSKAQTENAYKTVVELGLESALDRRFATLGDISINDVIFADRTAKPRMNSNVFDEIASSIVDKKPKNLDKVEEVSIDKFISDIIPNASSIELLLENKHTSNLVSLVAPVDPTAGSLFKWNNNFSWAYNGDMADSMKERVKKAGGSVSGDLCCRLGWYNFDDLDLHMVEPDGHRIYFRNKRTLSPSGGILDVDMNGSDGERTRQPVENIYYKNRSKMKEGTYKLQVNNWCSRERTDKGFEVELDYLGTVNSFVYEKPVAGSEYVTVVEFTYSHKGGINIISSLSSTQKSKTVWGIQTGNFHKVNVMMLSPNFWDGSGSNTGNKHYFFMLNGCKNERDARGFFNEFLRPELEVHRKTFEIVGSKMMAKASPDQLSGLGFSSTQRNSVLCRVTGSFNRMIKVVF